MATDWEAVTESQMKDVNISDKLAERTGKCHSSAASNVVEGESECTHGDSPENESESIGLANHKKTPVKLTTTPTKF